MNWQDIARRNGSCDDFVAPDLVVLHGLVDDLLEVFVLGLTDLRLLFAELIYVPDRCLAGDPAFREGARRELVGAAADRVAGAEEAFNGQQPVVSPLILRGRVVFRTARPRARTRRMGAHDVGLRRGQFGVYFLGIDILRRPDDRLPDRHAEEILPPDRLLVRVFEGLRRDHADGTSTGLDLLEQGVVAQACRDRVSINVIPDPFPD